MCLKVLNVKPFIRVKAQTRNRFSKFLFCWAKGHYTEGAELIDSVLDVVRKEAEGCEPSRLRVCLSRRM